MVAKIRFEYSLKVIVISLATWLALSGCRRSEPTPSPGPTPDMSQTVPIRGEAKGYLHKVMRTEPLAQVELGLISVEQSVAAFQALHGRLPRSLEELQADGFSLPELPPGKTFRYVPETGRVWVADVPRQPKSISGR